MNPVETAHYPSLQPTMQRFDAFIQDGWGVWTRLLQEEYLKGVFTREEDARAFAGHVRAEGQSGEVRKMWIVVNESAGEAYALGCSGNASLVGVDLDFRHRTRIQELRKETLARLSDEELHALGLRRV